MPRRSRIAPLLAALVVIASTSIPVARAADAPPSYQLRFLGPGAPVALNNAGTVAGARLDGSSYVPLVSVGAERWTPLPVPAGADSVFPTDLNDAGVIVGVAYTAWNPVAVRWTPSAAGYAVEVLPRLPGDASSYATAVNDLGQVVGARRALGYVPAATTGWLYSDALGVVDLHATYGLAVVPVDINDAGQVIGGVERLTLATGALEDIGAGPSNYNPVTAVALNDAGLAAGTAALRSTSLNIVSAFRFDGASTWTFLAGSSRYTIASSINARGDVGYGEQGAGLYLDGLGAYPVWRLLAPEVTAAGWTVTGSGVEVNDLRQVATVGRNAVTGASGGLLLTPVGTVQPPAAPVLTGAPHPATPTAPWDAISLSWTSSPGATSYVVERRGPGEASFSALTPGSGTIQTIYDDTAVNPGSSYAYRVLAVGVAGASLPSNEVTVVAPGSVADTTAPAVTILSPARNARVSGIVRVVATATDAVGVVRMDIRTSAGAVLGTADGSSITYDWNTAGLKRGSTQTLVVRAYDAAGNVGSGQAVVRIAR